MHVSWGCGCTYSFLGFNGCRWGHFSIYASDFPFFTRLRCVPMLLNLVNYMVNMILTIIKIIIII